MGIDGDPAVLAHDVQTNELSVQQMVCGQFDLKWELEGVGTQPDDGNHVPDGLNDGPFGIEAEDGFFLAVKDGKVIKDNSDCDLDQLWLWEWDDDGEFGHIVPKADLKLALELNQDSQEVDLKTKGNKDFQKWKLSGFRFIPKVMSTDALSFDEDGNLVVDSLICNGENQKFKIVELACEKDFDQDDSDGTDEPSGPCKKYTIEACEDAIKKLGIARGGKGYDFAGSWSTKGCYAYKSGSYVNHAYYGTGGTQDQKMTKL